MKPPKEAQGDRAAVWLNYDQAALDAQYDHTTLVPDPSLYTRRLRQRSDAVASAERPRELRYGPGPEETMDVFGKGEVAHLHLHGGAWRALEKADARFVVTGLRDPGVAVAVADFGRAPQTRLPAIVSQVRAAALALLERHDRLIVSGHSSGAHLAGTLLDARWWGRHRLDARRIAGAVLVSGPYDLVPVRLSARQDYLNLTEEEAADLSVGDRLAERPPPVHLFWGASELAEFQRQGRHLHAKLAQVAPWTPSPTVLGGNHFDLYELFGDPAAPIAQAARALAARPDDMRTTKGEDR